MLYLSRNKKDSYRWISLGGDDIYATILAIHSSCQHHVEARLREAFSGEVLEFLGTTAPEARRN